MLKLRISTGSASFEGYKGSTKLDQLFEQKGLRVEGTGLFHQWVSISGDKYFVLGNIVGIRHADGTLAPGSLIKIETARLENPNRIPEVEGRFLVVKVAADGSCDIWSDQFGRSDVYWQMVDGSVIIGNSLELLPIAKAGGASDNVGTAHALVAFGGRPAKQHTLYKDVKRLGVNQGIRLSNGQLSLLKRDFTPASTSPLYDEKDLHRYADIFIEAIRARASNEGNVVYLSSGWDSTSILATLVHLFGKRKVRAVIGRMRYSERSGVINQFELDRARAVADYFGIRLDIVEWDYRTNADKVVEKLQGLFRSQHFGVMQANHFLIAEATAKMINGNETIFAGEMSDGAHNLGYSQFATIFHPASIDFREYSDKMGSYLYGPTFLGQLHKGAHEQDPIWQVFKQRHANTKLDTVATGDKPITLQFLSSFFLRGGRLPLYSIENTPLLTAAGRKNYVGESERVYLAEAAENTTQDNLYAQYLHLYNSFHWQGATIATLEHTAEAHGLHCVFPFHDSAVIDFLSAMPESWGRGLDLNPTKYPLKWMLKNRIDYPMHLQVGPHSYTYDVDPNFTLFGEILHASSFKPVYSEALRKGHFIDFLDSKMFDRTYIDGIVKRYLNGEELVGQEMNDLGMLATHSAIGVYGS